MTEPTEADPHKLVRWLLGATATQVMGVVTKLDLADRIGDGEAQVDDLAEKCGIPSRQLSRLLRALTGMGLCVQRGTGRYALSPTGSLLRKGYPGSLRDLVRLSSDPVTQEPWLRLDYSLRTGRSAFQEVFGTPVFERFEQDGELGALYHAAMSQRSRNVADALPEYYDFTRFSTVVDVGGGDGTLLTAIMKHVPHLRGVVFDTAAGTAQARDTVHAAGLTSRCQVIAGDFFDTVPPGADLYLLKSITHDWDDAAVTDILVRCRAALPPGGRLLIIEPVLPETVESGAQEDAYFSDLNMLVLHGGMERTRADFDRLCAGAGLKVTDVVPLPSRLRVCLIETVPL